MASHSPVDAQHEAPTPDDLDAFSPADPVEDSPLLELPPELRNRIYRYVFSSSEAITPVIRNQRRRSWSIRWDLVDWVYDDWEYYDDEGHTIDNAVNKSILSTSQAVKVEAMEVLYGTKCIRGTVLDVDIALQNQDISSRVRRVEITKCSSAQDSEKESQHLRFLLKDMQRRLPRIKSIAVLSDDLSARSTPVMSFIQEVQLGPATCIDIGRYQLEGEFNGVQFVNRKLQEMWPAVRATPEDYDGVEEAITIIDSLDTSEEGYNMATWASHTSLRCWVDIQQRFISMHKSGRWAEILQKASAGTFEDDTDDKLTYDLFKNTVSCAMRCPVLEYPLLRSGDHVLMELEPNDDAQLLDEASEFLATIISDYHALSTHPSVHPKMRRSRIVWGETWKDTGKTALQCMVEQHDIALSDGACTEFVLDPILQSRIPASTLIDRALALEWIGRFQGDWIDGDDKYRPTPEALKQLTYLHLAVSECDLLRRSDYHRRREDWAKDILQRYTVASNDLSHQEIVAVGNANINDVRTIVSTVLDIFKIWDYDEKDFVKSFHRDGDVPVGFDSDVFAPLGWNYGPLFARAWRRYGSRGRLSKALARQWAKEGNMW